MDEPGAGRCGFIQCGRGRVVTPGGAVEPGSLFPLPSLPQEFPIPIAPEAVAPAAQGDDLNLGGWGRIRDAQRGSAASRVWTLGHGGRRAATGSDPTEAEKAQCAPTRKISKGSESHVLSLFHQPGSVPSGFLHQPGSGSVERSVAPERVFINLGRGLSEGAPVLLHQPGSVPTY